MGTSHVKSDIVFNNNALSGINTITATTVTADSFVGDVTGTHTGKVVGNVTGQATGTYHKVTSYFQMGDHQYIIFGAANAQADVEAAATAMLRSSALWNCMGGGRLYRENAVSNRSGLLAN